MSHPWTLDQRAIVSMLYILAILTGTFRSLYRWYISRFWWEDIWATFALLFDIICFVKVWLPRLPNERVSKALTATQWMEPIVLTSGLWAARMSMIATIIRITNHCVRFRRSTHATAIAFGIMWIAVLVHKIYKCVRHNCIMRHGVAISQLVTDIISDLLLLVLPLWFLRGVNIEYSQRVLLVSSFASSVCIAIISITHSIFLFLPPTVTATSLILAHVKTALALIICNLLVIVTLVYRLYRRNDLDLHTLPTKSDGAQFTSVFMGNIDPLTEEPAWPNHGVDVHPVAGEPLAPS